MNPILPDNILRCLPDAERQKLGKEGRTAAEVIAQAEVRAERDLHAHAINELNRRQIPFIHAAMHKRSTLPVGWPDFTVFLPAIISGVPLTSQRPAAVWLVEFKVGTNPLSADQKLVIEQLRIGGHDVDVLRDLASFVAKLRSLNAP